MLSQFRAVAAILLSIFLFVTGNGLITTLVPVRGELAGFSNLAVGLIGSAYYAGFVVGCFGAPRLLARIGHVRTFAVAGGGAAATVLLQSLYVEPVSWALARLMFGFMAACIYMVTESWLNERASNATRGRILAMYMTVNYGGIVLGQWAFTAAAPTSFVLFNIAAIAYALCLMPVGLTRLSQPAAVGVPSIRPLRTFQMAPVGVAGCVAVGFANGAVWSLAPLYATAHGLHHTMLALFMIGFTAVGALVQTPVGRLSDYTDRRYVIAASSFLAGLAALLLTLFGHLSPWIAIGLFALHGASALPIYGLSVAHANDRIPREDFVETSATLLLVNASAAALGPTLAATLMAYTSPGALFVFVALVQGVHTLFVLWRIFVAERPSEVHREPYAALPPQATPTALELDPRGPETTDPAPG